MFGSGMFLVLGVPVYVVLAAIGWGYYNVVNVIAFSYYLQVQWFDKAVSDNLDVDKKVYTLANYLDYPARKMWLFEMLMVLGLWCSVFPVTNLWTMPMLGLAAYYNDKF